MCERERERERESAAGKNCPRKSCRDVVAALYCSACGVERRTASQEAIFDEVARGPRYVVLIAERT